jgi:protein SCO1
MSDMTRRNLLTAYSLAPIGIAISSRLGFASGVGPVPELPAALPGKFETLKGSVASRRFPNVEVVTQKGKNVRFYDDLVKDKIVLISFFYSKCEKFCPPQTANLVKVQKLLGDRVGRDIFMYSISLKPQQDTPEMLLDYAEMHGIQPGWELLTGKPENLELLRVKLGFKDSDPEVDKDTGNHIGMLLFGNDKLDRWSGCPAISSPEEIVRELAWMDSVIPKNGQ